MYDLRILWVWCVFVVHKKLTQTFFYWSMTYVCNAYKLNSFTYLYYITYVFIFFSSIKYHRLEIFFYLLFKAIFLFVYMLFSTYKAQRLSSHTAICALIDKNNTLFGMPLSLLSVFAHSYIIIFDPFLMKYDMVSNSCRAIILCAFLLFCYYFVIAHPHPAIETFQDYTNRHNLITIQISNFYILFLRHECFVFWFTHDISFLIYTAH